MHRYAFKNIQIKSDPCTFPVPPVYHSDFTFTAVTAEWIPTASAHVILVANWRVATVARISIQTRPTTATRFPIVQRLNRTIGAWNAILSSRTAKVVGEYFPSLRQRQTPSETPAPTPSDNLRVHQVTQYYALQQMCDGDLRIQNAAISSLDAHAIQSRTLRG